MEKTKGISLITLIITVIVIIVLAATVIFNGLNTPEEAQFAKFTQEFSSFQEVVTNAFLQEKMQLTRKGNLKTDAEIYYKIATGTDAVGTPTATGTVSDLNLGSQSGGIKGQSYYEITQETIDGFNVKQTFSTAGDHVYITDKGEVFVLPGFLMHENGEERWYVSANKYYEGEGVDDSNNNTVPSGLYDYFITSGKRISEYPFENDEYLDDADTIEMIASSYLKISEEEYYTYAYFIYHDDYYRLICRDGYENYLNIELLRYPSTLSDLEKMRIYWVDLQWPRQPWDGQKVGVPPILDVENMGVYDFDYVNNYEYDTYHGTNYRIVYDDERQRVLSVEEVD